MEKRNTVQRGLVLDAVRSLKCHATADDVYTYIIKSHPSVSKGTVYRNLNVLSEAGLIKRVEFPGEADRFDHCCSSHFHAKCSSCGKVFDIEFSRNPDLINMIENSHEMDICGYDVIFHGICSDCKTKKDLHERMY